MLSRKSHICDAEEFKNSVKHKLSWPTTMHMCWTPVGFILVSIYGDAHKTNQVLFELK